MSTSLSLETNRLDSRSGESPKGVIRIEWKAQNILWRNSLSLLTALVTIRIARESFTRLFLLIPSVLFYCRRNWLPMYAGIELPEKGYHHQQDVLTRIWFHIKRSPLHSRPWRENIYITRSVDKVISDWLHSINILGSLFFDSSKKIHIFLTLASGVLEK